MPTQHPTYHAELIPTTGEVSNSTNDFWLVVGIGGTGTVTVEDSSDNTISSTVISGAGANFVVRLLVPPGGAIGITGGAATWIQVLTGQIEDLRGYF
jgi:hypothetical protein